LENFNSVPTMLRGEIASAYARKGSTPPFNAIAVEFEVCGIRSDLEVMVLDFRIGANGDASCSGTGRQHRGKQAFASSFSAGF
jgi:hypothetical protein